MNSLELIKKANASLLSLGLLVMTAPLVTAQKQQFTPEKMWELKQLSGEMLSPDKKQIIYKSTVYDVPENKGNSDYILMDIKKKTCEKITGENAKIEGIRWTENGIAGTITEEKDKKIVRSSLKNPT